MVASSWEPLSKNLLLGFLLAIPCLFYHGSQGNNFIAMISGIAFLLARLYFLGCFEVKFFFSYAFGTSLMPILILLVHEIQSDGKTGSDIASLLLEELPVPFSVWQLTNMVHIIQTIVIWNSCFSFSFLQRNDSENDKYSTYKRRFRIAMFLIDGLLVTLCLCRHQNSQMPMVLFYLCVILSSLGIQYIQAYLNLRPFELCFLSSLYFGFLFIEFRDTLVYSQSLETFSHNIVILITTKICTFLFTAALLLCGILFIMDLKVIRENIMLLVFFIVFLVIAFEFVNAHVMPMLPKQHMSFLRLFVFGSFGLGAYLSIVLSKGLNEFCIIYMMMSLICLHYHLYTTLQIEIIQWLLSYCFYQDQNFYSLSFYVIVLTIFIPLIPWFQETCQLSIISSRKLFHLLTILLFSLNIATCHTLLHIAMAGATVLFFLIEIFQLIQLSSTLVYMQKSIKLYIAPYLDDRDKNRPIILSHVYLLLGCALPIWLVNIMKLYNVNNNDNDSSKNLLSVLYSSLLPMGLVTVGVGDAVAAVVGSNFGRLKWIGGSNRTLEGTLAGCIASLMIWYIFYSFSCRVSSGNVVFQSKVINDAFVSLVLASLLEAITDETDNLIIPLYTVVSFCTLYIG